MPIDIFYHGLKLRLRRKSNSIEFKILFSSKLREEDELRAIRHSILLGGNFVDVGANIGYYSLMAAKFGAGKVIAIEPNPELIAKFGENIALNSFDHVISVVQVVLGEMARKTKLYLKRGDLGSSSLILSDQSHDFIQVIQKPLKTVLEENSVDIVHALKIDVEGYEDRVLMPFFASVEEAIYPKLVVIEKSSRSEWKEDVLGWMTSNGYDVVKLTRGNAILLKAEA